ncbi:hypothetical protein MKZ38_010594 [Zalerion maritima]|uniref:Uncharacterized protein n=1 Tax=Zalerion maritima TaxID=339359 RepID=A0AAD5WUD7_9PEZI|nr:hypothetical protein MKZ38_010594 [Zalerion maritima]
MLPFQTSTAIESRKVDICADEIASSLLFRPAVLAPPQWMPLTSGIVAPATSDNLIGTLWTVEGKPASHHCCPHVMLGDLVTAVGQSQLLWIPTERCAGNGQLVWAQC